MRPERDRTRGGRKKRVDTVRRRIQPISVGSVDLYLREPSASGARLEADGRTDRPGGGEVGFGERIVLLGAGEEAGETVEGADCKCDEVGRTACSRLPLGCRDRTRGGCSMGRPSKRYS